MPTTIGLREQLCQQGKDEKKDHTNVQPSPEPLARIPLQQDEKAASEARKGPADEVLQLVLLRDGDPGAGDDCKRRDGTAERQVTGQPQVRDLTDADQTHKQNEKSAVPDLIGENSRAAWK